MRAIPLLSNPVAVAMDDPSEYAMSTTRMGGEAVLTEQPKSPATGTSIVPSTLYNVWYGQSSHILLEKPRPAIVSGVIDGVIISQSICSSAWIMSAASTFPCPMCPVAFPSTPMQDNWCSMKLSVSSTTNVLSCRFIKQLITFTGSGLTLVSARCETSSCPSDSTCSTIVER